jgi:hypothetical protein
VQAVVVVPLVSGFLNRRCFGLSQQGWITADIAMQAVVVVSLMRGFLNCWLFIFGQQ